MADQPDFKCKVCGVECDVAPADNSGAICPDHCEDHDYIYDRWDEATRGKKMSDATGRVIFKYQMPVLEQFTMRLPMGAEIIRMADQGGMFWLWAVVRTDVPDEERKFWAFKTGGKQPDGLNLKYIGFCAVFVQMELGLYIFEEVGDAD